MFRRFMILCWVLFSIFTLVGLVGFVGYQVLDEPVFEIELASGDIVSTKGMTVEQLEQAEELKLAKDVVVAISSTIRAYEKRRENFLLTAWLGAFLALASMLWNIIWHTAHWVWMGRHRFL